MATTAQARQARERKSKLTEAVMDGVMECMRAELARVYGEGVAAHIAGDDGQLAEEVQEAMADLLDGVITMAESLDADLAGN